MEQHPIPQQITSYEFKLVEEMTLRQFAKAAGGIIIALLINATKVVFFVRWPLMFIFAAGGLAMAFLPFQDRPLETWLVSFIRSIYSPTIYIWKKKASDNWLEIDMTKKVNAAEDNDRQPLPLKNEEKVKEFIESLPSVKTDEGNDSYEEAMIKQATAKPVKAEVAPAVNVANEAVVLETKVDAEPVVKAEEGIPVSQTKVNLGLKTERLGATGTAVFGSIPMPDTPSEPNVLAGMVTDANGKIIESAIVEIQDSEGNPTRVLKTNALGQFKASTQLANGEYLVIPEKDGVKFDRVKVVMNGNIVQPIKIQAIA